MINLVSPGNLGGFAVMETLATVSRVKVEVGGRVSKKSEVSETFLFFCVCLSENIEASVSCLKFLGIKLSCHRFDEGPRSRRYALVSLRPPISALPSDN